MIHRALKFVLRYCLTAGGVAATFTAGLFFRRGRERIRAIAGLYGIPGMLGDNAYSPSLLLPKKSVDDLIPARDIIVACPAARDGNISTLELVILDNIIKMADPGSVFEIGTFNGRSTINFARNSRPEAKIYTLDLTPQQAAATAFPLDEHEKPFVYKNEIGALYKNSNEPQKSKIVQLYGDSGSFDFTPYYNTIDFVFVDGSHQYEYTKSDSQVALRLLRNGRGMIVWHDYNPGWAGVVAALHELYRREPFDKMVHIDNTSLVMLACG